MALPHHSAGSTDGCIVFMYEFEYDERLLQLRQILNGF